MISQRSIYPLKSYIHQEHLQLLFFAAMDLQGVLLL